MLQSIHPSLTPSPAWSYGAPSFERRSTSRLARGWKELIDFAVFFPGSLVESALELEAHCRRRERETGTPYPVLSCDELGAEHVGFSLRTEEMDPEREGLELFRRLAPRDDRVAEVSCVESGSGFARFRISYRRR